MLKTRLSSAVLAMSIAMSTLAGPNDVNSAAPPAKASSGSDIATVLFQTALAIFLIKAMFGDSSSGATSGDPELWRY